MSTAIKVLATALLGASILDAQTPLKTVRVASGLFRPLDVQDHNFAGCSVASAGSGTAKTFLVNFEGAGPSRSSGG